MITDDDSISDRILRSACRSVKYSIGGPILRGFPGTFPVLWNLKGSLPMSHKILFGMPNVTGFFQDMADNSNEHSDFFPQWEKLE